jgi:hypothetical protein
VKKYGDVAKAISICEKKNNRKILINTRGIEETKKKGCLFIFIYSTFLGIAHAMTRKKLV